jgi:hypothetical protein
VIVLMIVTSVMGPILTERFGKWLAAGHDTSGVQTGEIVGVSA